MALCPGTTELLLTKLAEFYNYCPVFAVNMVPPLEVAIIYYYG